MNIVDALFGHPSIATGNSAAAVSQKSWAEHQCLISVRNAEPGPDYWRLVAQYRPEIYVPQGFADWYAIGNELH